MLLFAVLNIPFLCIFPAESAYYETFVSKKVRLLNDGNIIPVPAFGTANAVLYMIFAGIYELLTNYHDFLSQSGSGTFKIPFKLPWLIYEYLSLAIQRDNSAFWAHGLIAAVNELKNVRQAVFTAMESGYRHIDTAASYTSEDYVAQAVKDAIKCGIVKREDVYITTKLDLDANTHKKVVPALKLALKRLQLDYVDLFLIHTPYNLLRKKKYDLLDIWNGMEDAKKLGLTKSIGTANFEIEHLAQILPYCTTIPAVNQLEVNPTFTNAELVKYCQEQGIIVTAYGPMGFTVPRENVTNPPPPSLDDPVLVKTANKYGVATSQVVLRYSIDRGTIPLSRSSNKKHIQSNIDLFEFCLTVEEVERISKFNVNRTVYGYRRDAIFEDYRIKLLQANRRNKKLYPLPSHFS